MLHIDVYEPTGAFFVSVLEKPMDADSHVVAPVGVGEVAYGLCGFLVKEDGGFAHRERVEDDFCIHGNWDLRL